MVIRRGDLLHTDVGLCYLGLCTDTQEMAYVLKLDETDAPGIGGDGGGQSLAGCTDRGISNRQERVTKFWRLPSAASRPWTSTTPLQYPLGSGHGPGPHPVWGQGLTYRGDPPYPMTCCCH